MNGIQIHLILAAEANIPLPVTTSLSNGFCGNKLRRHHVSSSSREKIRKQLSELVASSGEPQNDNLGIVGSLETESIYSYNIDSILYRYMDYI